MTNTRRLDTLFRNAVAIGLRDLVLTAAFGDAERRYTGTYGEYSVSVAMSLGFNWDWLSITHCTDTTVPLVVLRYRPGSSAPDFQRSQLNLWL